MIEIGNASPFPEKSQPPPTKIRSGPKAPKRPLNNYPTLIYFPKFELPAFIPHLGPQQPLSLGEAVLSLVSFILSPTFQKLLPMLIFSQK